MEVGKQKKPACIVPKEWPVRYYDQKNAWMDTPTFIKWFDGIFFPCAGLRTGLPVQY